MLPLESKPLRWSFLISFIVVLVYLLYFYISTDANTYHARRIYGKMTNLSTYQGFARSALITLLLLIAVFNSFRARAAFILGGVFILFMLISRSDFYAFLALSAVLCVIFGIRQPKYFLLLLFVTLEVALLATPDIAPRIKVVMDTRAPEKAEPVAGSQLTDDGTTQEPASGKAVPPEAAAPASTQADSPPAADKAADLPRLSRQFEVLDFSSSKSWASRLALQRKAIGQIVENPLMGKFGGHVLTEDTGKFEKGHAGRYSHDALSAWVSYGLAGFLIYALLILAGFVVPARQVILKQQDVPLWTLAFMLNFVCLLLVIVSKPVFWPLPALGWGLTGKALIESNSDTRL